MSKLLENKDPDLDLSFTECLLKRGWSKVIKEVLRLHLVQPYF